MIDEFPFFSFLLGDLHPHVLGLPFVLLAIAVALHVALAGLSAPERSDGWRGRFRVIDITGLGVAGLVSLAVIFGALAFLNTWDYPIYLALLTGAIFAAVVLRDGLSWGAIGARRSAGQWSACWDGSPISRFTWGFNRSWAASCRICLRPPASASSS